MKQNCLGPNHWYTLTFISLLFLSPSLSLNCVVKRRKEREMAPLLALRGLKWREHVCLCLCLCLCLCGCAHIYRQVARSKNNLAQVLFAKRLFKEAEPICIDVLNILLSQRGPEHSEVYSTSQLHSHTTYIQYTLSYTYTYTYSYSYSQTTDDTKCYILHFRLGLQKIIWPKFMQQPIDAKKRTNC
jgi:hypothetical protein